MTEGEYKSQDLSTHISTLHTVLTPRWINAKIRSMKAKYEQEKIKSAAEIAAMADPDDVTASLHSTPYAVNPDLGRSRVKTLKRLDGLGDILWPFVETPRAVEIPTEVLMQWLRQLQYYYMGQRDTGKSRRIRDYRWSLEVVLEQLDVGEMISIEALNQALRARAASVIQRHRRSKRFTLIF